MHNQRTKGGGRGPTLDIDLLLEGQRENMAAALIGIEPERQRRIMATWTRICRGMIEESYLIAGRQRSTAEPAAKPAPGKRSHHRKADPLARTVEARARKQAAPHAGVNDAPTPAARAPKAQPEAQSLSA